MFSKSLMYRKALILVRVLLHSDTAITTFKDRLLLHKPVFHLHKCTQIVLQNHDKHEKWWLWWQSPISTDFLLVPFIGKRCSGSSPRWMSQEISSWPFLIISTLGKNYLTYGNESLITSLKFPVVHLYTLLSEKAWNWNSAKITLLITPKTSQVGF